LAELRLFDAGLLSGDETWVSRPPAHVIVPTLRRRLDPKVLRYLLDAIRTRSSVEVNYQSFSQPDSTWRRISPHALAFDGFRWHARAWCYTREAFRDFVIGRMSYVRSPKPDDVDPDRDSSWNREITLKIGPHPKLKAGWKRATELDYGMVDGVLEVTTKACLVPYFRLRFGLDGESEKLSPPR
jgi:predicted DNA-binding transcriptional regulator YafY